MSFGANSVQVTSKFNVLSNAKVAFNDNVLEGVGTPSLDHHAVNLSYLKATLASPLNFTTSYLLSNIIFSPDNEVPATLTFSKSFLLKTEHPLNKCWIYFTDDKTNILNAGIGNLEKGIIDRMPVIQITSVPGEARRMFGKRYDNETGGTGTVNEINPITKSIVFYNSINIPQSQLEFLLGTTDDSVTNHYRSVGFELSNGESRNTGNKFWLESAIIVDSLLTFNFRQTVAEAVGTLIGFRCSIWGI